MFSRSRGANTFSGGTTISAGILSFASGSLSTTGAISFAANSTLQWYPNNTQDVSSRLAIGTGVNATLDVGNNNVTLASGLGGGGSLTKVGWGLLIFTGDNTYTGTTTINVGTLQVGAGGTVGNLGAGGVNGSATLAFDRGDNITIGNTLSGSIGLLQEGSGVVSLTGDNTYTGNTTINVGSTLQVGGSNANVLPNGAGTGAVVVYGTLDLNGYSPTVGGLGGSGTVTSGIAGTSTLNVGNNNVWSTFAGVIQDGAGTVALTKIGTSTLTLTGANTFSGGTTIVAGILSFSGGALGTTGTISFAANSTLQWNQNNTQDVSSRIAIGSGINASLDVGNNNVTLASGISGGGSLTKVGLGTLILTGNNTYTGTTTISVGTLQIGAGGTVGNLGTGGVSGSAMLVFDRSDNLTVGNILSGGISLLQEGSGTLTLAGNSTYTGNTTINAGSTLQVGGNANVLGTGIATVNGTLDLNGYGLTVGGMGGGGTVTTGVSGAVILTVGNGNANSSFSGVIQDGAGTVALSKIGSGTLTLTGTDTFSGGTNISAGMLSFASGALGAIGAISFSANSTLQWYGTNAEDVSSRIAIGTGVNATFAVGNNNIVTLANGLDGGGSLTKIGSGTLILAGNNVYTGTTTVNAGTLQIGGGATMGNLGTGGVNGSATLAFDRSDDVTLGNVLSGSITLVQEGSGILTLTGNNTYSGGTTINAGSTLQVGSSASVLGTGVVTVNGTLDLNGDSPAVGGLGGSGTVTSGASGAVTLTVGNGNTSSSFAGVVQDGAGAVALSKIGSGTLTLTGTDAYSGGTTISAGILSFTTGALGTTGTIGFSANSTLQWYGTNTQDVSSRIAIGTGVNATLDVGNNIVTLASGFGGGGSLTKVGSGTLILTGGNTYTGTTTINAGALQVGAGGTVGSLSAGTVNGSATLAFDHSDNVTIGNVLSGGISLLQEGSGILTLTGNNTYSGGTTIASGSTLQVGSSASVLGTGAVTVNGTLDLNGYTPAIRGLIGNGKVIPMSVRDGDALLMDGASLNFGSTLIGEPIDLALTIENDSAGTLTIAPNSLVLPAGFSLATALPASLAPNQSAMLLVQLDAASAGNYSGSLSFATNQLSENPFHVTLNGTVSIPAPTIAVGSVDAASGVITSLYNGSPVTFGSTTAGTPVEETFQITDTGTGTLTLDANSLILPAGFSLIAGDPFPTSVSPGESAEFTVQLDAATAGSFSGTMSFADNDVNNDLFRVNLSGTVNALAPQISVGDLVNNVFEDVTNQKDGVNFGNALTGSSAGLTFEIKNTGNVSLTIDPTTLSLPAGFALASP